MNIIFPELIAAGLTADSADAAIRKAAALLYDNGFVKESYTDAVIARERVFPTGIQLKNAAIALPHTDIEHVIKPAICVVGLSNPVEFSHMGEPERKVQAQMLFMMAIQDPDMQIETIGKVLNVLQSQESLNLFLKAKDKASLYEVAKKYLD